MGVFDLFGREPKSKNERQEISDRPFSFSEPENKNPISVFKPDSYSDVEKIIDALKTGKNAVVHLTAVKTETAIRIIDMLSGAVYALGGGVYEMEKNIFMFSPNGVEVY